MFLYLSSKMSPSEMILNRFARRKAISLLKSPPKMDEMVEVTDALSFMEDASKGMMAMIECTKIGAENGLYRIRGRWNSKPERERYSLRTVLTVTVSLAGINGKLRKMP